MRYPEIHRPFLINCHFNRDWIAKGFATIFLCLILLSGASAMAKEKPLDILFNNADTDGNGLISETEWHAAMLKRMESIDTNGDGNLSREEFEKTKETVRDRLRNRSPR